MPPVVSPVATIPYEIASDIEYAEKRLELFDRWSFSDHRRAARGIIDAVEAYGRVWGKLAGRNGFSMDQGRPYGIRICRALSNSAEPLPVDPVVQQAIAVASAFAEFYAKPLVCGKGIDKATLLSELARRDRLARMVKDLGDLVRDLVQEDYVRLQPGDWVRVSYWRVVGRVAAVRHCRARVTTAESYSTPDNSHTGHRYTTRDLVRTTLEKIPPPVPLPLCVPGFEWFHKAVEEQRAIDFRHGHTGSRLFEYLTRVRGVAFAIEMLFLSEQPSEIHIIRTKGGHVFPEESCAHFPDWIEGRLRKYYALAAELQMLDLKQARRFDPPPSDQPPHVVQTLLLELGREMIDALALYIADQVGHEIGTRLCVFGEYVETVPEDLIDVEFGDYVPEGRRATLVSQSGRTLTVEFDSDEELPGLHEVDITDITA